MRKILLKNEEVAIELENGIIIAIWKSSSVDLTLAQRAVKYRIEATEYISYPILIDIRPIKTISKPARDFLASPEGSQGIIAAAILIGSPISSIIGNFFLNINKPLKPTKVFSDGIAAKKWLGNYITKP